MKISILQRNVAVNSILTVFLSNGREINGIIFEIESEFIKIQSLDKEYVIFNEMILGWEIYTGSNFLNNYKLEKNIEVIEKNSGETNIEQKITPYQDDNNSVVKEKIKVGVEEMEKNEKIYKQSTDEQLSINLQEDSDIIFIEFEPSNIPWKEHGIPVENLFKGREQLISKLISHYKSPQRTTSYMLYGLTRTGKSSILKFLGKNIEQETVRVEGKVYKYISFYWELAEAAAGFNARDMWYVLLRDFTLGKISTLVKSKAVPSSLDYNEIRTDDFRPRHLREIIIHLKKNGYFPIFLIDEFTYIETLLDKKVIDSSFLATLRRLTFDNLACFIFAGTYNLRQLIENPKYGITGQLVNIREEQVGPIDAKSARELTLSYKQYVNFTDDAVDYISKLTNNVPFFIQVFCKNCAYYCLNMKKNILNYNDIEFIASIMVGDEEQVDDFGVERITEGAFMNNQIMPSDSKYNKALITTLCHLNKGNKIGQPIDFSEIQKFWATNGIEDFRWNLNESVEDLKAKGIIIEKNTNGSNSYLIGVELFRRWWYNYHSDINFELSVLKSEN